jgi:hypothetical protein
LIFNRSGNNLPAYRALVARRAAQAIGAANVAARRARRETVVEAVRVIDVAFDCSDDATHAEAKVTTYSSGDDARQRATRGHARQGEAAVILTLLAVGGIKGPEAPRRCGLCPLDDSLDRVLYVGFDLHDGDRAVIHELQMSVFRVNRDGLERPAVDGSVDSLPITRDRRMANAAEALAVSRDHRKVV